MPGSTTENIAYRQRQRLNAADKQRIARAVAVRLPGRLLVDHGHRHHHRGHRPGSCFTKRAARDHQQPERRSDPERPTRLRGHRCRRLGAFARPGIVGEATVDFIRQFKVDIGLIGISGIEADGTLRDFDYREVKVAQPSLSSRARSGWRPTKQVQPPGDGGTGDAGADRAAVHRPPAAAAVRRVAGRRRRTLRLGRRSAGVRYDRRPGIRCRGLQPDSRSLVVGGLPAGRTGWAAGAGRQRNGCARSSARPGPARPGCAACRGG